jgi:hypothetical protein
MECEHPRDNGGLRTGIVVTAVNHSRPRKGPPKTILTCPALSMESCRGTHDSRVMQGLHNRDSLLLAGIVGSRRDEGEGVVKMNEMRLHTSQQRTHFLCGIPGPKRSRRSFHAAQDAVL